MELRGEKIEQLLLSPSPEALELPPVPSLGTASCSPWGAFCSRFSGKRGIACGLEHFRAQHVASCFAFAEGIPMDVALLLQDLGHVSTIPTWCPICFALLGANSETFVGSVYSPWLLVLVLCCPGKAFSMLFLITGGFSRLKYYIIDTYSPAGRSQMCQFFGKTRDSN